MRMTHSKVYAIILILCMLICLSTGFAATAPAPICEGGPEIASKSAVVMDVNTGALLYAKNAGETGQPSSLTKLVTAYIVLKELDPGSTLTVSADAAKQKFPTAATAGSMISLLPIPVILILGPEAKETFGRGDSGICVTGE